MLWSLQSPCLHRLHGQNISLKGQQRLASFLGLSRDVRLTSPEVASQCMFVSTMAFFARISDPAMGGTYMTMLNTMSNLGGQAHCRSFVLGKHRCLRHVARHRHAEADRFCYMYVGPMCCQS